MNLRYVLKNISDSLLLYIIYTPDERLQNEFYIFVLVVKLSFYTITRFLSHYVVT